MKGRQIHYSEVEAGFLRANASVPRRELTEIFNAEFGRDLTIDQIKAKCTRMGLKTGRTGCFKPGNIPHPDAGAKGPNRTSFVKGQKPQNWKPVGHVRFSRDTYQIKVFDTGSKDDFVPCQHLVWMLHNGPVPAGHIVILLDGDPANIDIENLRCIHRGANVIINKAGLRRGTPEMVNVGITVGELRHTMYRRKQEVHA